MNFNITTRIGDHTLAFREPIADPFVRSTTRISWWDRFKSLFHGRWLEVSIIIDADNETIFRVMNLDRGVFPRVYGETGSLREFVENHWNRCTRVTQLGRCTQLAEHEGACT